jgi:hypothetical protein
MACKKRVTIYKRRNAPDRTGIDEQENLYGRPTSGHERTAVSYLVIDAVIDLEWTRERFKGKPDEFFIKPKAIAAEIWHIVHQERSAWSFNVELRPFGETW